MKFVYKSSFDSKQLLDDSMSDEYINPFCDFDMLLNLYYANVYHARSIRIKSNLLSQIEIKESNIDKFLPVGISPKYFLKVFTLNLELYGNAGIESAGSKNNFYMYNIKGNELRTGKNGEIFQVLNSEVKKLDGFMLKYYSPRSHYYGEPDYLAALKQIALNQKADIYNEKFFDNGARPDMAIIYENAEPSQEQLNAFKDFFGNSFKGYQNSHNTLVLFGNDIGEKDAKIRFENLGGVDDLSFEKLKKVSRDEIAAAHGLPPRLLGITESSALGGSGELIGQLHQFNEIEIKPKIELIEGFFENIGIKLRLKPIDVTDFKDDGEIVTNLINSGIISVNEAREILGWQKTLGGQ